VFETWDECRREIHKKPKFKKFATRAEAEAFQQHGPFGEASTSFDRVVYTDGGCIRNGKAGAVGGYGIYFGPDDPRNVSARLEGKATNNIAELTAVIKAIELVQADIDAGLSVGVYTDSTYAMLCCGTYGAKCAAKGWAGDIPNVELVQRAYTLAANVELVHVAAHTGGADAHSLGNAAADALATQALQITEPKPVRKTKQMAIGIKG